MKTGEKIKLKRIELGLSLNDLANKVGSYAPTVMRWENGDIKSIKTSMISKLANALKVTPEYLLDDDLLDSQEVTTYTLSEIDRILLEAIQKLDPLEKMQVYGYMKEKGLIRDEK